MKTLALLGAFGGLLNTIFTQLFIYSINPHPPRILLGILFFGGVCGVTCCISIVAGFLTEKKNG